MHSDLMAGGVVQCLIFAGLTAFHGPYVWWEFVAVAILLAIVDYATYHWGGHDE